MKYKLLIICIFVLFNLFFERVFCQDTNSISGGLYKLDKREEANLLWEKLNFKKVKDQAKISCSATDEDFNLFLYFNQEKQYKDQQLFYSIVESPDFKPNQINEFSKNLLKSYINEYEKFKKEIEKYRTLKLSTEKNNITRSQNNGCLNADFEEGNFNGWTGYDGYASTSINPSGLTVGYSRITIVSGNGYDPKIGGSILPIVAPGGLYSVRLEDQISNWNASRLTQTFVVQSNNANFTYKYAVVLKDGEHSVAEQAYFKVKVKDINGKVLLCGSDSLTPTSPYSNLIYYNGYYYKNWTTATIPLSAYIGQTVTIEFTASDCIHGGHLGYAYIDGSCMPLEILSSSNVICHGIDVTLTAPEGYKLYNWIGPGIGPEDTTRTISVDEPGNYQVNMSTSLGCFTTLNIQLNGSHLTGTTNQLCLGDTATLFGPYGSYIYSWSGPGIVGASNTRNIVVNQIGTYYLHLVAEAGGICESDLSYELTSNIDPDIGPDIMVCKGDSAQLHAVGGSTFYQWSPNSSMIYPNSSNPIIFPSVTTTYIANTCGVKDTIVVHVKEDIVTHTTTDILSCSIQGVPISVSPEIAGNYSYSWSPTSTLSNANIQNPIASPLTTSEYSVTVSLGSCETVDSVRVIVPEVNSFYTSPHQEAICTGESVQLNTVFEKLYNFCGTNNTTCSGTINNLQIGTATNSSSSNSIYNGTSRSSKFQLLFTQAELNSMGITSASTFNQIGFNIASVSGNNIYQNFSIKMGCTNATNLQTSYINGLFTVFNPKNILISNGINYYSFDKTYDWDGASNIIIEICYLNNSTSSSSSIFYSNSLYDSFLSSSSLSACNNTTGTLSNNRPNTYFRFCKTPVSNNIVYSWSPSIGLNNTAILNPISNPTVDSKYYLEVVDTLNGCRYIDSVSIEVGSPFTITAIDSIVNCNSTGTQLTVLPYPAGNYSYNWSPSSFLNNSEISSPITTTPSSQEYIISVTSSNGCKAIDSVFVKVPYRATFYAIPESDSICVGETIQLNALYQNSCGTNNSSCSGTNTFQVGNQSSSSSTNSISLFKGSYNGSRIQMLFKKSELNALGINYAQTITGIGFNIASVVGNNIYQNFTIKMGCTSLSGLPSSFQDNLYTVFNTKNIIINSGINYFNFDNTYDWDGLYNIIIEICYNNSSTSSNSSVFYSATLYNSTLYANGNSVCNSIVGTNTMTRANTYFKLCSNVSDGNIKYQWFPSIGLSSDTIKNPIAIPPSNTNYYITATDLTNGCIYNDVVSLRAKDNILTIAKDTLLCSDQTITLDAGSGFNAYLWNDGSTGQTKLITSEGVYWVEVTGACGTQRDTCSISYTALNPKLNLGSDTLLVCNQSQFVIEGYNPDFSSYLWQDGSVDSVYNAMYSGLYKLSVNSICGVQSDSIYLNFHSYNPIFLGNDTTICEGDTLKIEAGAGYNSYIWQNNEQSESILINLPGTYSITATDICNVYSDSIHVKKMNIPICNLGNDTTICEGHELMLNISDSLVASYLWDNNTSDSVRIINNQGIIWAEVSNKCGVTRDSLYLTVRNLNPLSLGTDTTICNSLTLFAGDGYNSYIWQNDSTSPYHTAISSGIYSVTTTDLCGVYVDSIQINYSIIPRINLGSDVSICNGDSIIFNVYNPNIDNYLWQNGDTDSILIAKNSGLIWAEINNICGSNRDSVFINLQFPDMLNLGSDTILCNNSYFMLNAGTGYNSYLWNNGSQFQSINIDITGSYIVTATNQCEISIDSIFVQFEELPSADIGNDMFFCIGDTIIINANVCSSCSILWQNGSNDSSFETYEEGIYYITSSNYCGIASDTIELKYLGHPNINLGNDTIICEGSSLTLTVPTDQSHHYLWQDSSSNSSIIVNNKGIYWVEVTNICGTSSDTLIIESISKLPNIELGKDSSFCAGDEVRIETHNFNCSYLWHDGSTLDYFNVKDTGLVVLIASNDCGSIVDSVHYTSNECKCDISVPTAFSPNDDGENDKLILRGECMENINFYVYDRWGQKVFEAHDYSTTWDGTFNGKQLDEAVFIYYLTAQSHYNKNSKITRKGNISLIR